MRLTVLSASDLDQALPMPLVMEAVAQAYRALSQGRANMPPRQHLATEKGVSLCMPAYLPGLGAATLKLVSVYPDNPALGLPTTQALLLVLDPATGTPLALLEGARLTALRTGAASGVATLLLAQPQARSLALLGAGGQAWFQFLGVAAARPLGQVRVFDPDHARALALVRRIQAGHPHLSAQLAPGPRQALEGAQIICCATTSREPVFDPSWVEPGAHINGVGSFTPQMHEVPVAGLGRLRIFVDSVDAALSESGELMDALAQGALRAGDITEIGHALAGGLPGRQSEGEITFFKSVGLAVQDAAAAGLALQRAASLGLGQTLEL